MRWVKDSGFIVPMPEAILRPMKATMTLAFSAILSALAGCGSADNATEHVGSPSTTILVSDAIEATGDTGIYTYGDGGATTHIRFPIATDRADPGRYHDVRRIGETAGVVAALDSYGSRNGAARCANGRESWVRLFSIAPRRLTDSIPVENCLERRDAGKPPVPWQGDDFTINGAEPRRFTIVDGKARSDEERG